MGNIDFQKIIEDMLGIAKKDLGDYWDKSKPLAEQQFKIFAENIKIIGEMKVKGEITEEQARLQMNIQKNSIQIVLLSLEGLGILAVERTINDAIKIVRDIVNTAIGWNIL